MKKLILYFGIVIFLFSGASVQTNAQILNGAYKRTDIMQKKPMPLPTVRETDVFWSQQIWRIIDLREKMNQTLYYPSIEINGRVNLINLLLNGIENGQITPYDASLDDDFKVPMSYEQVKESFGATTTMEEKINFDTGEREMVQVVGDIRPNEIKQYMVKEEWYFDKGTSTLNVRIIGICPIREYIRAGDTSGEIQRQKLFWVYYPEARPLLATNVVMNPYNAGQQMSFDDLFIKRLFHSYIVAEENVYNNRNINAYLSGKEAMLESKKIENKIFNFEQDLWEY
jgi:gliding motility associated protien GldN